MSVCACATCVQTLEEAGEDTDSPELELHVCEPHNMGTGNGTPVVRPAARDLTS